MLGLTGVDIVEVVTGIMSEDSGRLVTTSAVAGETGRVVAGDVSGLALTESVVFGVVVSEVTGGAILTETAKLKTGEATSVGFKD